MAYSTIPKGSLQMNTKLYTGTGSAMNITGVGFQPDMTWIKPRSVDDNHILYDSIRGVSSRLIPNLNSAAGTVSDMVTSFNSDGVSLGTNGNVTANGATFAAWNWKANGAGSANTDGSINSTVSVNATSGFSIATFTTLNSTISTVGHGLGVVPDMYIVKTRANSNGWFVYHKDIGNTKFLRLETTGAETTNAMWNNTSPTSDVFTINANNFGASTSVAYCFAEKQGFSKFSNYIGNGNADGTFVYTGFSPAFVMVKATSVTGENWQLNDNKRKTFNVNSTSLFPNSNSAESSTAMYIDMLSNGFKARETGNGTNGSGVSYIYMAFAENPFVATSGTSAIPVTAR